MQGEGIKLNDRRRSILALLSRDGKVQVAQLSALLGASEVTIRSDLTEMEKEGLLERVHGGAMPARRSYLSMNMQQRRAENVEQKMRIAAAAAERIREGETLMVNAGTTALLRAAGYRTGQVGKWHLDRPGGAGDASGPTAHGYDFAVAKPRGTRGYQLPAGANRDGESGSDFVTDYLTDQAVAFIDASREAPFFLYLAYHAPHTPVEGRRDLVEKFTAKVPLGRLARIDDVVNVVCFLASSQADYMTGQAINISGGREMH